MKLNLHIIFDNLSSYKTQILCDDSIEMNLIGIRYLPDLIDTCVKDYIYLTQADSSNLIQAISNGLSLLILGTVEDQLLQSENVKAILVLDTPDIQTLFEHVLSTFDYYNQWENDLTHSFLTGTSIQTQLDICARVLDNPIALFDTSYVLIAKAGRVPDNYSGTIWESVIKNGYSLIEYIPAKYRTVDAISIRTRKPIMCPPLDEISRERFIGATLMHNGTPFAKFGILNFKEFTLGQLSLTWQIQSNLESSAQIINHIITTLDGSSFLLNQLLDGTSVDSRHLSHFLQQKKWLIDDTYYLLRIIPKYNSEISDYDYPPYMFRIKETLPLAYVFYYDNTILSICHCKYGMESTDTICKSLTPLLQCIDLTVGISMMHTGYDLLHSALLQCTAASQFGKKKYPDENVFFYQDIYSLHIMEALATKESAIYYCHPQIQRIALRKDPWELELIHTLEVYLQHGRSISATASKLYLHRNSLLNRIHSIEKLISINLDTLDEKTTEMLYFSCFIIKYSSS